VTERDITTAEIVNADEIFLTGTGTELAPVVEVNAQPIGSGRAGEITRALYTDYMAYAATHGQPIEEAEDSR